MVALERAWNETDSTLDGDSVGLKAVTEADAEVKAEAEALDAYSQIVSSVAERLIPSVASLRVTRTVGGWGSAVGAGSAVAFTPWNRLVGPVLPKTLADPAGIEIGTGFLSTRSLMWPVFSNVILPPAAWA